jgi:class 3 adenylate cyclase/tetratricopeptide (TPR) repeat protein
MAGGPVTLLFTDLVDSTALLQRVGDERAHRILRAHRQLLRAALAGHGGREVKWLGDGLLTTFASVADAVRCAVSMQQAARGRTAGERLGLRVGLHVGEVLADEDDYVGTSVVLARRLCDRAGAGQILCSGVVVELLRGRHAFRFAGVGALELKGFPEPMPVYEVGYEADDPAALLRQTPFAGRTAELRRLAQRLDQARAGRGGVVLLMGEPGIGKTRTLEEFAEQARAQGALVLWGRCYEGDAGRPYGPFAEAFAEHARTVASEPLRADLGLGAAPLTRLVPGLRERLPDLPEPVALEPYEERIRLLDAVAQFLLALGARSPTVLVLDDLHWADQSTVALLRHVARFAPRGRLLVAGAYRDVEIDRAHPLADALGTLPRETSYEQVALTGLEAGAVRALVDSVTDRPMPAAWVDTLARETSGNPFFIREVLLHLVQQGSWPEPVRGENPAPALAVPETVRQVIDRRLERLSESARRLLGVAAAFTAGVRFEVARCAARLDEGVALHALDEALGAQLLTTKAGGDTYDFSHALVRHTLYEALSPARQVRLHRQIAEAMEAVWGERAAEHAAEIARHYLLSATLPGAERGVPHCLAAAEQAERSAAFADAAAQLRATLELLPATAPEHFQVQARLGLALVWALRFDDAVAVANDAATRIADLENPSAAADYLARVVTALDETGASSHAATLARRGLEYVGERRDPTWALLKAVDIIERETKDRSGPGIPLDTPERREVAAIFEHAQVPALQVAWFFLQFSSRAELESRGLDAARYFATGQYRRSIRKLREEVPEIARAGKIGREAWAWATTARLHVALGEFDQALAARRTGVSLADRLPLASAYPDHFVAGEHEWRMAMDEGWDAPMEAVGGTTSQRPVQAWFRAAFQASIACAHARMGRAERAMRRLSSVLPAIERAPAWASNYVRLVCHAAETLWLTERTDWVDLIERNLREKVIEPDFHYVMEDGRLALARLCALQHRFEEAIEWFAKARTVLDAQGARPLRAIVDYDEALMYARRAAPGDAARGQSLAEVALRQFRALGMPGWIRRAETLLGGEATTVP